MSLFSSLTQDVLSEYILGGGSIIIFKFQLEPDVYTSGNMYKINKLLT